MASFSHTEPGTDAWARLVSRWRVAYQVTAAVLFAGAAGLLLAGLVS